MTTGKVLNFLLLPTLLASVYHTNAVTALTSEADEWDTFHSEHWTATCTPLCESSNLTRKEGQCVNATWSWIMSLDLGKATGNVIRKQIHTRF